jgi:uncharacterized phage protein gp47/JayE
MTLTAQGLEIKTTAEVLDEIETSQRTAIGAQLQLDFRTPLGQVNSIFAIQLGTYQQGLRLLADAMDPDNAQDAQLDAISGQNGVVRDPARKSFVLLDFTGVATTVIPAGSVYRVPDGPRWETTEAAVIGGGGTVSGVPAESEETGPVEAIQDTITEQVTIISGVATVNNPADATKGNDVETDAALRQRREAGFSLASTATDGSLRSRVGELNSVAQSLCISNRSAVTDGDGRPEHSFEVVVWPAQVDDDPVFDVIRRNNPSGIKAVGDITGTSTDSQGVSQPVAYSVADPIEIYFDIIITPDPLRYGGDPAVEAAIVAFFDTIQIGQDVILSQVQCAITSTVGGITDIEVRAKIGSAPGPGDTSNITIELTEIAITDTGKITVDS